MRKHIFIISFIILFVDQVIKFVVLQNSTVFPITIIPSFFKLSFVTNTGGAWGIFKAVPWLITVVSIIFLIDIVIFILKKSYYNKLIITAYGLLIGGILGNLVDRIVHQFVIDYLDFTIFSYHFPVFNLADVAIVVGVVLLIIDTVRGSVNEVFSKFRLG